MSLRYSPFELAIGGGDMGNISALVIILGLALGGFLLWRRGRRSRRLLERRVAELSALSEVGRAIVAAQLDVNELCMLIYRQARQIVDTWIFQLGLFEENRYRIKVWIVRGERRPEAVFDLGEGEGIVGWMRRTGQPLLVRDFETELDTLPARPRYISDDPPRSAVFVPLIAGETVIGAMAIQSHRTAAFTHDHRRVLSIVANQAAAAIANARLYHTERRRRQMADTLRQISTLINSSLETDAVLRAILEGLERLVGFDGAAILLLNEDKNTLTLRAARGLPLLEKAVGQNWPVGKGQRLRRLAATQQPLLFGSDDEMGPYHQILDFPPDHSCLGAPILIRDQLLGVLTVDCREPDQYGAEDTVLVAALANQAASALENAHLYSIGQEEAWISTALLEVAEAISLAEGIDEVLKTVVRITPLLIGVDRCAVLLWDEEEEACQVAATYESDESEAGLELGQVIHPGDWLLLDQLWESGLPAVDEFGGVPGAPTTQDVETTLLALPLRAQGELSGAMIIGFTDQISFTEHRLKLIAGVANQAALGIESAQLAAVQQEEAWVSQALLQVAEAVANLSELDEVLDVVVRLTPLLVGVESCLIYLWDAARQVYVPGTAYGLRHDHLDVFYETLIPIAEWPEMSLAHPTNSTDDGQHQWERADGGLPLIPGPPPPIAEALGVRLPFALPMLVWGNVMGALVVDTCNGDAPLSGRRLNILSGVAQQAATAIQNARLSVESVERQKLERELDLARQIQISFLPAQVPQVPGWDLAAHWQGARQVSGDFYDFIPLPNSDSLGERWGLVIADVSDKGVPAALFTALSRTLMRTVARSGQDPARALALANNLILVDSHSDLFVTLFYAILDPEQGMLTYANAGHNLPLLFNGRSGQVTSLEAKGMALGVMAGIEMEEKAVQLEAGDLVIFYTDGVTDALDSEMQEFGLARLQDVVAAHRQESAASIVQAIDQAVTDFVGHTPQFDDLTLIVLKRQNQHPDLSQEHRF